MTNATRTNKVSWTGVFPAVTTTFRGDRTLDAGDVARRASAMVDAGCRGVVAVGSLGENGGLSTPEKLEVVQAVAESCGNRVPVLAAVAEPSALRACRFAAAAERAGAKGLMVLPPKGLPAGSRAAIKHYREVARTGGLPIMAYNNPVAYGTDVTPSMFGELADLPSLVAIKESSGDIRRITDIEVTAPGRYRIFIGVDDLALEAFAAGAVGWVAGLAGAFPKESVRLFELARAGRLEEARGLYRWFVPLLRLDAHPRFVPYIKLCEGITGVGSEIVRRPHRTIRGSERDRIEALVGQALENRP